MDIALGEREIGFYIMITTSKKRGLLPTEMRFGIAQGLLKETFTLGEASKG